MRLILIDNESGYIYADTADLKGFDGSLTDLDDAKIAAARALIEHIGYAADDFTYETSYSIGGDMTYTVYRADIDGSEAIPVVHDGQDQEAIDAVERLCDRVGSIKVINPAGGL